MIADQSQRIVQLWQLVSPGKLLHSGARSKKRRASTNHVLDGSRVRVSDQVETRRRAHRPYLAVEPCVAR